MADSAKSHVRLLPMAGTADTFIFPILLNAYLFHQFSCFGFICLLVSMVRFNMIH